jgi:hypothetical protein
MTDCRGVDKWWVELRKGTCSVKIALLSAVSCCYREIDWLLLRWLRGEGLNWGGRAV